MEGDRALVVAEVDLEAEEEMEVVVSGLLLTDAVYRIMLEEHPNPLF